ncbi:hypothetical protein HKX48_007060 [Thoreauomyces humboldtii]|nr:hypothetical protein HKX48_007060 [Thoreauomyces humboldtii]
MRFLNSTAATRLVLTAAVFSNSVLALTWQPGNGTHYGPYPTDLSESENGYQYVPVELGVGCSTGIVGGDPRWNAIIAAGVYPAPNPNTVYPKTPTVAVSEAAYPSKSMVCYKTLMIKSADNPSLPAIEATIVDYCPKAGCLWPKSELAHNVDLYGEATWKALGGTDGGGYLNLLIAWPDSVVPWGPPDADDGDGNGTTTGSTTGSVSLEGAGGLSSGVIAGAVVGSLFGAGALTAATWYLLRRRNNAAAQLAARKVTS